MTKYPWDFADKAWGWFAGWVAIVIVSLLLGAMIIDMSGAKSWNHAVALPAGVVQLTKTAYLIDNRTPITPSDICKGAPSGSDTGIEDTSKVPRLDNALYVECVKEQTWGDTRARSVDYGHGLIQTLTTPWWIMGIIGAGILCSLYTITTVTGVKLARRRLRKEQEAKQKADAAKKRADHETVRKELRLAYAKGEIDDLTFMQRMDDLFKGQLPPSD